MPNGIASPLNINTSLPIAPGYVAATAINGGVVGVFIGARGDINISWASDEDDPGFTLPADALPALIEMLKRADDLLRDSESPRESGVA